MLTGATGISDREFLFGSNNQLSSQLLFTKRNATNRPMVDADLHAGILSSKRAFVAAVWIPASSSSSNLRESFKTACSTTI